MDDSVNLADLSREIAKLANLLGTAESSLPLTRQIQLMAVRVAIINAHDRAAMQAAETLRIASIELTRNFDIPIVLEALLDYLGWLLPYDCAKVHLLGKDGSIHQGAVRDFREAKDFPETGSSPAGDQAESADCDDSWPSRQEADAAMTGKESITTSDIGRANGIVIRLIVPLLWENEPLGIIAAERLGSGFSEDQLHYAEALASQAAVAIRNAHLFSELTRADIELVRSYDATIEGWSRALELRDHDTEGHTLRVTEMSLRLGAAMRLSEEELKQMRRGALLHDIGKVAIPDSVLLKPMPLNAEERQIMNRHPEYAKSMLENIAFLTPAMDIPYCHHEKWDGSGYPQGLKEKEIPLSARIFAIVDVWDALTHDRPYHRAWPKEEVKRYLKSTSGLHFDPIVVSSFLQMISDGAEF